MLNLLNQENVLKLSKSWQPLDKTSVQKAITQMCSMSKHGNPVALAINIEYEQIGENEWDFESPINMTPLAWDEWVKVPIRPFDSWITTTKSQIRVPTVIINPNFDKTIMIKKSLSSKSIFERDNFTCQVSGKRLNKAELSVDHVKPRSKKGKNDWTNCVTMDKNLNSKKGDKSLEEMGWKLLRQPFEPPSIPSWSRIKEIRNRDWVHFLFKERS